MSKIINTTQLTKTVNKLWDRIKVLNNANITNATLNAAENKITFTKADTTTNVDVSLANYARLDRNNDFNGDVSWNGGLVEGNWHIGTPNNNDSFDRSLGFRGLTTKNFADGYIASLKVFVDSTETAGTNTRWKLWAIKKGATSADDTVLKAFKSGNDFSLQIESTQVNNETHNFVTFPINESFTDEVYFIVRSVSTKFRVCEPAPQYRTDVVNLNKSQPPTTAGERIDWTANATGNTAVMFLIGRESIGSLSEKIKKIEDTGSQYVLKDETTDVGGTGHGGKVVKLDTSGKLNANMLPAIATNEFIPVDAAAWNEEALRNKDYQNGDIIFHSTTQKRYLCINREHATFSERFVELNSKDGVVSTVNLQSGAITLNLTLEESGLKFKVNNTDINTIEIISDSEIESMINSLT